MLFHCPRTEAHFPAERLCLVNQAQARLLWDEHGGTFVLRVEGLEVVEVPDAEGDAWIRLEVDLPEPASLAHRIESFVGRHSLRLGQESPGAELSEALILAACHIPGKNLFIFCEEPQFTARLSGPQTLELRVCGIFKSRRVTSKETDMVIHLEVAAMCRVLAGLMGWAGKA